MEKPNIQFILISGLSGAGKSQALRFFEDQGHYCVDNLPAALVPQLAELSQKQETPQYRIAICVDARSGEDLKHLPSYLNDVRQLGFQPKVLFLDADDSVLHQRYLETRRRHPSANAGNIQEGIQLERDLLSPIREQADLLVDTSQLKPSELRERIATMIMHHHGTKAMSVEVLSFGFKYGVPPESNLVLDVRFLPNPFYDDELRDLTGEDPDVKEFVLNNTEAKEFFKISKSLVKYLLPKYEAESKAYLTIAIGCTGGKHRSVAISHEVTRLIHDLDYDVRLRHRDIEKA
jgi:UPF0042 nucleotide-binding protein